jgi:Tol biopolymer transport system component
MRRLILAVVFSVLCVAAVVVAQSATERPMLLPIDQQLSSVDRQAIALAPDGSRFVYVANARLYSQATGGGQPTEIAGTEGASSPVFSPDGRTLAFWTAADGMLKRVPAGGGDVTTIAQVDNPMGIDWGAADLLLVGQGSEGIVRVSANGGTPETVVTLSGDEIAYGPQILPGGDAVLFTVISGRTAYESSWSQAKIVVQPLVGGDRTIVVEPGRDGRLAVSGHLLWVVDNQLLAAEFDAQRRELVAGEPTVLASDVRMSGPTGATHYAFSDTGSLVYLPERSGEMELVLVGLDGTRTTLGPVPNGARAPRVSIDGELVTLASEGSIYTAELANLPGTLRRVLAGTNYAFPVYSDDNASIVLGTILPDGLETVYISAADGTGDLEILARPARAPEQWLPGTRTFAFITHKGKLDYDAWTYSLPNREVNPISRIPVSAQLSSRISPDGRWMAYMSNETGSYQVYVEPWPQTGARFQATTIGGQVPTWSADSGEIYYEYDAKMYAATFSNGLTMFGAPRELPINDFVLSGLRRNYDQTGDLGQFVMLFRSATRVAMLAMWTEELS